MIRLNADQIAAPTSSTKENLFSMTQQRHAPLQLRWLALLFIAVAAAVIAPGAAQAAGPELGVEVTHSPSSIPRNEEQMRYLLNVRNEAPANPEPGDELTCDANTAWWFNGPTFGFEWVSNGAPATGPETSTATTSTYEVQAADAGHSLQCLVTGTNAGGAAVSFSDPVAVEPIPTTPGPPRIDEADGSRPVVTGTASEGSIITCVAPTGWSGSPTWSFEWLKNGVPLGGEHVVGVTAMSSEYEVQPADIPGNLQCAVTGATGNGGEPPTPTGATAVAFSINHFTSPAPSPLPPNNNFSPSNQRPFVDSPSATSGPVTLELELPPGETTRVSDFGRPGSLNTNPEGWSCSTQDPTPVEPAKLICSRSNQLAGQAVYPGIEVLAAIGPQTPDPAVATATVSGGGSPPAMTEDSFSFEPAIPFGIESFETQVLDYLGENYTQAGGHPFSAAASFELSKRTGAERNPLQIEFLRDLVTDLPPGFVGNPQAAPQLCSGVDAVFEDRYATPACPRSSIVGSATLVLGTQPEDGEVNTGLPVYAIEPERGAPAQFITYLSKYSGVAIPITARLRPAEGYAVRLEAPAIAKNPVIFSVAVKLCGFGVNLTAGFNGVPEVTSCKQRTQTGIEPANPKPFLTDQPECSAVAPRTRLAVDSWENRGAKDVDGGPVYSDPAWRTREAVSPHITGCDQVPFSPDFELQPTVHQADTPTGLNVSLSVPTDGLESPNGIAQAYLKKAVVRLPEGMAVNPSAADGLGACALDEIGLGNNQPVTCPGSSKIGSAAATTPLLAESLSGSIYLAKQGANPFGSLLALYLVLENAERGVRVKLPGRVTPDPRTGQLVATFDDNPQLPVGTLDLHFNDGNRAALLTPPTCGTYDIVSELTPWSGSAEPTAGTRTKVSTFNVTSGPGGAPCPTGALAPNFSAGLQNPVAASTSPFVLNLSRNDGTQRINGLDVTLPPGLTAYLRGIPYCSDAALASIPTAEGTGAAELNASSCPAASQIGTVSVGAGGGSNPIYVSGRAYLAGPYKGAPLSIAVVAPAVAGPFDLGNVVVRNAAYVNPTTAQITVVSDPIPTILYGIPLDIRDIRVSINRPDFTLAPTSCETSSVDAMIGGELGSSAAASNRFQVGDCASLAFKPRLSLRLKGKTRRAGNPALIAKLSFPPGRNANAKRVSVALPRSEFLDQGHIRTICTRVQFAANACPRGSIYGRAEAMSPLLDYKLTGNVYLRSSSNELPDLVVALRGPAHQPLAIDLVGRIDSKNGGIRTTFETAPDAPVSSFTLRMQGGKKGLLDNSRNICRHRNRATVRMDAHNGMTHNFRPLLKAQCGKKAKKKSGKRKGRGR